MKTICCILLVTISFSVAAQQSLNDVAWLAGTWKRTNSKPGRTAFETWSMDEMQLKGLGVTMRGSDTVFVEKLRVIVKENTLYYVADVPENGGAVLFRFVTVDVNAFVCENQHHDFPKHIAYSLKDDKLTATISGNGKSIEYLFERVK